ncbi:unnamed protein product [Calypogeia fissa]
MATIAISLCLKAADLVIAELLELHSAKKYNTVVTQEIELFIKSLNDNIDLLKEQLPNKTGSWAIESLTTDLNKTADYLEEGKKNGNFQKYWDAKKIKDELATLRENLINNFQLKFFVTTLEVVIDGNKRRDNFESKMVQLSTLFAAETNSATAQIRELLQPLVVGMRRQDERLQSFISTVRGNETKVETSSETQKFFADVLANLEDLTDESSSMRRPPPEDDRDEYLDPFTKDLMCDPVKCTDGHTYDRFSVFQYNLTTTREPMVIACDDLNMRTMLFQRFANEGVGSKFHSLRKEYREIALEVANKGHSAEALAMLKNVLQWAPDDTECLQKADEIKKELAAEEQKKIKVRALELANKGHSAEALAMLKNVLQWAPADTECLQKADEIKEELAAEEQKKIKPSAPPLEKMSNNNPSRNPPQNPAQNSPEQKENLVGSLLIL